MLDPAPFQTRLKQAQADLASARASVNEAQATQRMPRPTTRARATCWPAS